MGEGNGLEKRGEGTSEEGVDLGLAAGLVTRAELAEEPEDLVGFEVHAFDLIIVTATLDSGPVPRWWPWRRREDCTCRIIDRLLLNRNEIGNRQ